MKKAKASVKQQNTREQDETDFDFNSTDWKESFFHEITHRVVDGTISWNYTNFFTEKYLCFVKLL